jgi:queuine/archaeosine tRNA-ribosyltransferase
MEYEHIWLTPEESVSKREPQLIQFPKLMRTVLWNSSGFHVATALPKVLKFNSGYYTREILKKIKRW